MPTIQSILNSIDVAALNTSTTALYPKYKFLRTLFPFMYGIFTVLYGEFVGA